MIYRELLDKVEPEWRAADEQQGNAGIAIAAYVLETGRYDKRRIPEFSDEDKAAAYEALKANGYIERKDGRLYLVEDEDGGAEDGLWWVLLGATAQGWLERA